MTVHIGQLTSEVRDSAPPAPPDGASPATTSPWEERAALAAALTRLALDRLRTATGPER